MVSQIRIDNFLECRYKALGYESSTYLLQIRYDLVQHLQNSGQVRADGEHPRIRRTPRITLILPMRDFAYVLYRPYNPVRMTYVRTRNAFACDHINQRCHPLPSSRPPFFLCVFRCHPLERFERSQSEWGIDEIPTRPSPLPLPME